jgi:hypothetical protein
VRRRHTVTDSDGHGHGRRDAVAISNGDVYSHVDTYCHSHCS